MSLLLALLDGGDANATGAFGADVIVSALGATATGGAGASGAFGTLVTASPLSGAATGAASATGTLPEVTITALSGTAAGDVTQARRALSARYRLAVAAEERRRKPKIEEVAEELASVASEPAVVAVIPRTITGPELGSLYLAATQPIVTAPVTQVRRKVEHRDVVLEMVQDHAKRIRLRDEDDLFLMAA